MDMDQFKGKWNRLDAKIDRDIALNREIGKLSIKQKSGSVIDHFIFNGVIEIFASAILLIYSVLLTIKYGTDWRFLVSGVVFSSYMMINLVFNILSLSKIDKIDLFTQNVLDISRAVAGYKKNIIRYYQSFLYTLPLFVLSVSPLLAMGLNHKNIFDNITFYIPSLSAGLILAIIAEFLFIKYFLQRNLNKIESHLEYLRTFESNGEKE